jgi:hypothetical protein
VVVVETLWAAELVALVALADFYTELAILITLVILLLLAQVDQVIQKEPVVKEQTHNLIRKLL